MTDNRVLSRNGVLPSPAGAAIQDLPAAIRVSALLAAILLPALVLSGCTSSQGPTGSRLRGYAADLAGGAKVCEVAKVDLFAGTGAEVPMKVVNDGGWCAIRMNQDGPKPFDAGLLTGRPAHGTVLIHEVGDDTRIDYTPDRGFAGNDRFSIKLLPGNVAVQVTVAVSPPHA